MRPCKIICDNRDEPQASAVGPGGLVRPFLLSLRMAGRPSNGRRGRTKWRFPPRIRRRRRRRAGCRASTSSPSPASTAGSFRRPPRHPSLHRHGLRLLGVLAAPVAGARRHRSRRLPGHERLAALVTTDLRLARQPTSAGCTPCSSCCSACRGHLRRLARAGRSAQGRHRRGPVLGGGFLISARRRLPPPALADLARLGRDRRHRPRARLHLARLDPDQVVPGPARHGHRHGDHGVRRRRDDRLASRRHPDQDL